MYILSFMTLLGIFWVGQQTQLNNLSRSDRSLSWIHMVFLFPAISIMPFSTLAAGRVHVLSPGALLAYWANILLIGAVLYCSWVCAVGSGLVKEEMPPEVSSAIKRRILIAQALYAFGALLCVFSTYWSIGFIVLVELNYALAPRIPGRRAPSRYTP